MTAHSNTALEEVLPTDAPNIIPGPYFFTSQCFWDVSNKRGVCYPPITTQDMHVWIGVPPTTTSVVAAETMGSAISSITTPTKTVESHPSFSAMDILGTICVLCMVALFWFPGRRDMDEEHARGRPRTRGERNGVVVAQKEDSPPEFLPTVSYDGLIDRSIDASIGVQVFAESESESPGRSSPACSLSMSQSSTDRSRRLSEVSGASSCDEFSSWVVV